MITNETAKSTYTVISGKDDYAIGFLYNTNPDGTPQIKLYVNKLSESPLVYGTDYTLSDDGTKVILAEVNAGDRLDIIRDIPMVQLSDYHIGRIDPDQIENDMDMAVMRDQQLKGDLDFAIEIPEDHEVRIQECETDIGGIESLIPVQATESNKLADKDFVNSSIATSTATFKGTYTTLADLEAVTADANDYGFVVSTDAAGNTVYSRYKYNGTAWAFEYNLNNSSFTAEQWAAINSGITATIVDNLGNVTGKGVGEIFYTLRTDSSLSGAVDCDGSPYNTTDFIGAQSIGQLLSAGKVPYVSLATYAALLSTQGSVGVFGWDGVGTTAFRVPCLNDIFIETGTAAQVGDYLAPALPNPNISTTITVRTNVDGISHNYGNGGNQIVTGAAAGTFVQMSGLTPSSVTNSVYTGTTVQPNTVRCRAMVQLAVGATDEALETCTSVLADVAGLKSHEVIEFQAPTAQNNYTWYRKYRDGWVEQGGFATTDGSNATPITLPVEMVDANYIPFIQGRTGSDGYSGATWQVMPVNTATSTQTSTRFYAQASITGYNLSFGWRVEGMAATNN